MKYTSVLKSLNIKRRDAKRQGRSANFGWDFSGRKDELRSFMSSSKFTSAPKLCMNKIIFSEHIEI